MKTLISKLAIILSIVFVIGVSSSCVLDEYVDCADAQVQIINNSDYYVYYSLDPNDDYCYPENWLNPGESITVSYGEVHTTRDTPAYLEFYYKYHAPGYADYATDIEIESCYNKAYID